jgi:hypothetical protein
MISGQSRTLPVLQQWGTSMVGTGVTARSQNISHIAVTAATVVSVIVTSSAESAAAVTVMRGANMPLARGGGKAPEEVMV